MMNKTSIDKGQKIFYGWYIVAMAFICRFMATGVGFYIFNAFMDPLCEQRGWTRDQINDARMIGGVVTLIGMFIYGTLVTRVGPRVLMAIGPLISGVAFISLGQVDQMWQFNLFYILLFLGNGAMAGIVANTAVNNWFVMKRGQALGLSMVGVSLSGAILPLIAMVLIEWTGLSHAFLWIGIVILVVSPAVWMVVRDQPEKYGMAPDGVPVGEGEGILDKIPLADDPISASTQTSKAGSLSGAGPQYWTFSMVVRSSTFWKLGLAYAMAMMSVVAVMFQLAPRFQDVGFDKRAAMYMMCSTALLGASGKYVWGTLCDRFEPRRVTALVIVATGFGLGLGLIQDSILALAFFIVIFGFAMGGVVSTYPVMTAYLFGRDAYASVARFLGPVIFLNILGYRVTALSLKYTKSYDAAYILFIALNLVAAALILSTKRPGKLSSGEKYGE